MPESMGVESQLEEAARLTNLGFYKRARKILEPLCDHNERARDLLVIVEKLEADFEADRNIRRSDPRGLVVGIILLVIGSSLVVGVPIGNYRINWPCPAIALHFGGLWFLKRAMD